MRSPIASHSIVRWARAFMVLLALGTLVPATARAAGCLHPGGDRPSLGDFDLLLGRQAEAPADPTEPEMPEPPIPCNGALCSGLPGTPIPHAPNLLPLNPDWGLALAEAPRPLLASERLNREPAPARPRPIAGGLFRPPRAQAPALAPTA